MLSHESPLRCALPILAALWLLSAALLWSGATLADPLEDALPGLGDRALPVRQQAVAALVAAGDARAHRAFTQFEFPESMEVAFAASLRAEH